MYSDHKTMMKPEHSYILSKKFWGRTLCLLAVHTNLTVHENLTLTIPFQAVSIAYSNIYTDRKRKVNYCGVALMHAKERNLFEMAQLVGKAYVPSLPARQSSAARSIALSHELRIEMTTLILFDPV